MTPQELTPLDLDDRFAFECRSDLSCFNRCCRDLNQALTPYDTLRLRAHLGLTSQQFQKSYLDIHPGPSTGLPVASLRFADHPEKYCPFVSDRGCSVYTARPSSCRMYPLVRGVRRSRTDGRQSEHYALLHESHCSGFEQGKSWTVRQWIENQELTAFLDNNDAMLNLIALKNQLRPGSLSSEHWHWTCAAFYDLDTFRQMALSGELPAIAQVALPKPLPAEKDDARWLTWSLQWINVLLFARS